MDAALAVPRQSTPPRQPTALQPLQLQLQLQLLLQLLSPLQVPGAARHTPRYRGCLIGSTTRNVDPTPGVLSRSMRPLCLLMML